jgi:hypothetical protein
VGTTSPMIQLVDLPRLVRPTKATRSIHCFPLRDWPTTADRLRPSHFNRAAPRSMRFRLRTAPTRLRRHNRLLTTSAAFCVPIPGAAACDIGAYESDALQVANLDQFVSFCQFASCGGGQLAADSTDCPARTQGAFGLNAVFTDNLDTTISNLQINVGMLTNGNQWKLPSEQLVAARASMSLSETGAPTGALSTDALHPGQSVTVPFTICLGNRNILLFFVDVFGTTR